MLSLTRPVDVKLVTKFIWLAIHGSVSPLVIAELTVRPNIERLPPEAQEMHVGPPVVPSMPV